MVRKFASCLLLGVLLLSVHGERVLAALTEGDIQGKVDALETASVPPSGPFACGGLLHPGDMRSLAYYNREKEALGCRMQSWCSAFDSSGKCSGIGCEIVYRQGLPVTTIKSECNGGSCTVIQPHTACGESASQSKYRKYECTGATAECYSYEPSVVYDFTTFPYAYNCVVTYTQSPVDPLDPAGFPELTTRYDLPAFSREGVNRLEPAPGSNVTVPSGSISPFPRDSSMEPLTLDRGALGSIQNVMHPTISTPLSLEDYPPLMETIGKLMQPPEVKLILPSGSFGLSHAQPSMFGRLFSSLKGSDVPEPVTELIGNEPDALLLAAEYLRQIPLLEVEYVPVEIFVPTISQTEIHEHVTEWQAWLAGAKLIAAPAGITIDPALEQRIQENIQVMQSYGALMDSVREYRLHFPSYINALLSYVENVNGFFLHSFLEENAKRLEAWHTTYTQYLPTLRTVVRDLYDTAATVTHQCLVPACRMHVVPVKESSLPWDLVPDSSDQIFTGAMKAYLPEGPPLFEDPDPAEGIGNHDRRVRWHPFAALGSPLPDLTFDLSEIKIKRKISVPVLMIESHPLEIPVPPALTNAVALKTDLAEMKSDLRVLPRFHPPLFDLTFPTLTLPDAQSLFLVPEPPKVFPLWQALLQWRIARLQDLLSVCDSSGSPTTFFVNEPDLYGTIRNPAAVRAVTFVAGGWNSSQSIFAPPSYSWSSALYSSNYYFSPFSNTSLTWPQFCYGCSSLRPQRIIKQHFELDLSWENLQNSLLTAIDTWNANVRFSSILSRNELTREYPDRSPASGLDTELPTRF